jgi:hypothetical protein
MFSASYLATFEGFARKKMLVASTEVNGIFVHTPRENR